MDFDFDFAFMDFDAEGCAFILPIAVIGGGIALAVTTIASNLGFMLAAGSLVATLLFLFAGKSKQTHNKEPMLDSQTRRWFATVCFVAFLGCSVWGVTIYQKQAEEQRRQQAIEAEQARIEAEKRAAEQAENERLGLWGRAKRYVMGGNDETETTEEKTE